MISTVAVLARMVKIEHSVFALPFAYTGAFVAAGGWPGWRVFLLLTLAMVMIRSFAMAFNRLADKRFDSLNPRTQDRPLVTGEISSGQTMVFLVATGVVFVAACAGLNSLCLALSGPALAVCAFYSYTKRFTWLCHFVLGAALGLAPLAGWMAARPELALPAVLFGLGVLFWVAGFDILYACQDVEFDREHALHSVPARFGVGPALVVSAFCHINTALFFVLAGWAAGLSPVYYMVWAASSTILVLEHRLISEDDMSRVNLAFFTMNGILAVVFFAGVLVALYV